MDLNRLSKEDLVDLLTAYDAYIIAAADAGRLKTGWTPVCVSEFYSCEYQDVWRQGDNFDYMYDYAEHEEEAETQPAFFCNDVLVFADNGRLMCQFDGEDTTRIIRNRIQDIRDGDAFFIGTHLHYADGDAHQNLDEKDNPWIVYDVGGDSWFEEDISASAKPHLLERLTPAPQQRPSLEDQIRSANDTAAEQAGSNKTQDRPNPVR